MITVVIPVGPDKVYKKYLQECLDSVKEQSMPADEVILIDDMAGLCSWGLDLIGLKNLTIHYNPWLCGGATSFNFGVSLAKNELVIMLGSDDKLLPHAVRDALNTWNKYQNPKGYYFFDIVYSDTGETQSAANNCAMVPKSLWKHTGGFRLGSNTGQYDYIFLSMLLANKLGDIYRIESESPPYWYRRHKESVTYNCIPRAAGEVKNFYTDLYKKPEWGRYE